MGSNQGCSSLRKMGGQQEGICPMCMEEMDLTDQELQPCICGYEICLWCWHFIIQKATRDGSDARCPACHSPYDKEKILKRTISKERIEMVNANKKHKVQKTKQGLSDVGKDLNSIRVIRRNIVYIAGIPKHLSNEKTLRKKEYLGQYGKIVKIFFAQTDVSRQCYSADSCIVYATFSKEEEALRCIQVVNGYILDGRPLKASFGTTRYCYSWLNNLPCKNPDCLYVHDVVPQEDICSREEVIPFCTSKLQQCPGLAFTNLKQHSGSFLPPPLDTENSLPPLGLISNNRYMQSDFFGRSYASVAASHNQSKLSSLNENLVIPSSREEACFSSNAWDQNHVSNRVPTTRNEMLLTKHDMENFAHSKPFFGICHSKKTCSPDYKTATETNLVAEDNICGPSFHDIHMSERIIGELFLSHSDGNSQLSTSPASSANVMMRASAGSLNSLTNIGEWKSESVESITKEFSSEWDDLGAVSRKCEPFSSLQTLPDESTSTRQNVLPSYDWSRLRSDLGSENFNCRFEDESLFASFSRKSKGFSTFSTIATNLYPKLDKTSAILPTEPMLFHGEQKNLCGRTSSYSFPDFEYSHTDKTKDEKFLNESYIEQCEDRILSDILALDLGTNDDPGDTHSVLEQLGSSDDLSRISNSWLPSTSDGPKSYFSMMDDLHAAIGKLSPWSNGASGLTKNSSWSEIMVKKEACMTDSFNKFSLETSKTSKVLNRSCLLSASEAVSDSGSSLDILHSGSSLSRAISQHPYSNSTRRTTLSTPPGFPPSKPNQGNTQRQPHNSSYASCFSNTKSTSNSHTDMRYTDSPKITSSIASLSTCENPSLAIFNRYDKQQSLPNISNYH